MQARLRTRNEDLSSETGKAFITALVRSQGDPLRRFLQRRVKLSADVPDLVQEIYLRMLRIPDHEAIRSPEAYLFTVAQHVAHQHGMRQANIESRSELQEMFAAVAGAMPDDPAAEVLAQQALEKLEQRCISSNPGSVPRFSTTAGMAARCRRLRPDSGFHGRWSRNISPGPSLSSASGYGKRSREALLVSPYQRKPFNQQLYDEAAAWLIEFRSGDIDVAGRKEFYDWLRTSPEHMRAYLELAAVWNEGSALDPAHSVLDGNLFETTEPETNVIALSTLRPESPHHAIHEAPPSPPTWMSKRLAGRKVLYLAASLLLAASAGLLWYWHEVRGVYSTGVGEQHLISLSDGSVVELNAQSRIRIRYDSREREVDLLRGQALFNVAHDATRPFIVYAADSQVRAIGTQFDVYRTRAGMRVSVIEGTVAVLPITHELATGEVLLTSGEQAVVVAQAAVKQPSPDVAAATAWSQGHIVFHGTRLKDVATEFNRYNTRRLVIRAPELLSFKVTGIFSSTDPTSLIRFLAARPEMKVSETPDEIVVSAR
jgi:transmembrane sensor